MRLLETTSVTYLRRLAKEINQTLINGSAYFDGQKITQAKVTPKFKLLYVKALRNDGQLVWIAATNVDRSIFDGNGQHIVASREVR